VKCEPESSMPEKEKKNTQLTVYFLSPDALDTDVIFTQLFSGSSWLGGACSPSVCTDHTL